jgi:hypothetical protein
MEKVGIFYGHFCNILLPFGIFHGHLAANWYIFPRFGTYIVSRRIWQPWLARIGGIGSLTDYKS